MFKLTYEVTLAPLFADLRFVEAGAEVTVAVGGVVERMADDGEHRVADGHDGAFLASAADQPAVAFAEEGVGAGHGGDGLTDGGAQPRVALAGAGGLVFAGGPVVDGG